jgi:hypothetical protein
MCLNKLSLTAVAVLSALAASTASSEAAFSYSPGDLFLGVRQVLNPSTGLGNISQDFVVNIGNGAFYRDLSTPYTLTLGNLNTQLSTLFGATWATDSTVTFSIFGTTGNSSSPSDPLRLMYVGEPIGGKVPVNSSTQSGPALAMRDVSTYYQGLTESSVLNGSIGTPTNANSYTTKISNAFGSNNLFPAAGTVSGGLSLYRVPQTANGAVTLEGSFVYAGGDSFTFTPEVIPEPASALLLGLGAVGLATRRLRKPQSVA